MTLRSLLAALVLIASASSFYGADWPQFRGPNRDDVSKETGLLKTWPMGGPALGWTFTNAGSGYSGPAIVGGRLYMAGARARTEWLLPLDTQTAKELWATKPVPPF